jgi:hypothetical protein
MNAELQALFRAVITTLREDVRPQVADEQARIQLAAVLDILGKLQGMTAWAPDALQQQAQALQAGAEAFEARARRDGVQVPPAADADAPDLVRAEQRMEQLTDWLFAQDSLDASLRAELDGLLRGALRQQLVAERKRIPLTDFASMSAGGGKRDD